MRIYPLAIIPLLLALIALFMTWGSTGIQMYLVIGIAAATILVTIATLFQYTRPSYEAKQIPIENFSVWADVGEPAAELRRLSSDNVGAAVRIAVTDLGSLQTNAKLLASRLSMLVGKEGFDEVSHEKLHKQVESLANDISSVVSKLHSSSGFRPESTGLLEQHATQADRIANKLFEFERGKSEVVHIYVEPLRRAAEKLSRDLRLASANISSFVRVATPATTNP